MLPHDPKGLLGPRKPLPDHVQIVEPKDEVSSKTDQIARKYNERKYSDFSLLFLICSR